MTTNQENTFLSSSIMLMIYLGSMFYTLSVLAEDTTKKLLANPDNKQQVVRGKKVYMRFCAYCHGKQLEGQPNWFKPNADGKMPAPPHNKSGHTWHHADIVLFNQIKFGIVPPYAPEDYKSDMPAFKDTLKDDDIWAVLAFIKSQWPKENLEFQIKIDKNYVPF